MDRVNKYHEMHDMRPYLIYEEPKHVSKFTTLFFSMDVLNLMMPLFDRHTKQALRQVNHEWRDITFSHPRSVFGALYMHFYPSWSWRTQEKFIRCQDSFRRLPVIGKLLCCLRPCLRELSVELSEVDSFLNELKRFPRLERVSVSHISDFELEYITAQRSRLQSFTLSHHEITVASLRALSGLTELKNLEFERCTMTNADLNSLSTLTSLRTLSFMYCGDLNFTGVAQLRHLPLHTLRVRHYNFIPPLQPQAAFADLTTVFHFNIAAQNFKHHLGLEFLKKAPRFQLELCDARHNVEVLIFTLPTRASYTALEALIRM